MFNCIFPYFLLFLYGTLLHLNAINGTGLPVNYSWTASNGNKFTNLIEVLEGQTIVEAGHDMNAIGSSLRGNYTWKNQWYEASNGSGNAIVYESYVPNGNDITIYGKWVYAITYYQANTNGSTYLSKTGEILKGNSVTTTSLPRWMVIWSTSFKLEYKWSDAGQGSTWTETKASGTSYEQQRSYVFNGNTTLYAVQNR